MAARFRPELFEKFHWPFAQILEDSPLLVAERDPEDQFRTWLKLWRPDSIVWIGDVYSSGSPKHATHFRPMKATLTGNPQQSGGTGNGLATALLGYVYSGGTMRLFAGANQSIRAWSISPFVQDNWRISRRLTLNLGLRYDYQDPAHEAHGRSSNISLNAINPDNGLPGAMLYGNVPGVTPMVESKTDFSPRIGFAYDLFGNGKTSIRGGYSVYYLAVQNFGPNSSGFGAATTNFNVSNANFPAWK